MVGTTRRVWKLEVMGPGAPGQLAFVAFHGTFHAKSIEPEVARLIAELPVGVVVQCECSGAADNLRVLSFVQIATDMSQRIAQVPDELVRRDPVLALARAKLHVVSNPDAAATDLAIALRGGRDEALAVYAKLPAPRQADLLDALAEWQARRAAAYSALRYLPLARWTVEHLREAFAAALKTAGTFGAAPGVDAQAILDELARRGEPIADATKKLAKLRKLRAVEGDTLFRIATELEDPRVVGASTEGVYIRGRVKVGQTVTERGAWRQVADDRRHVLVHVARDGRELQRWQDLCTDRVVAGIALLTEELRDHDAPRAVPGAVRLADGEVLYTCERIERHDHELAWIVHERNYAEHTMTSELRRIDGTTIASFDDWIEDLWWDDELVYIEGDAPRTLDRSGRIMRAPLPEKPTTIDIDTADGRVRVDAEQAPWKFSYWDHECGGGWQLHHRGRKLFLAPAEPAPAWFAVELTKAPAAVQLAPPWIAFSREGEPIVFVAIAELASGGDVRVDNKRFARRAPADIQPRPPEELTRWYDTLVEIGITPPRAAAERDKHLLSVFDKPRKPSRSTVARVLASHAPSCVEHDRHWFYPDDDFYAALTRALADEQIVVAELDRAGTDPPIARIAIRRGDRTLERRVEPMVYEVAEAVDAALVELGSARRLYALAQYQEDMYAYLVITPAQRARAVAAGIAGIHPSATMPFE